MVSQSLKTSSEIRRDLGQLGVQRYFEIELTSEDAGYDKPDPLLFHSASSEIGIEPAGLIHVGDDYDKDVVGARAAGIVPVLLDCKGAGRFADCLAITSLDELLDVIDQGTKRFTPA